MHSSLALLSHLLAIIVVLAVFAVSEPNPFPAVVSLPPRSDPTRLTARPLVQQTTPDVEHDLLPYVLISTIDGALHAVDRDGGKVRWTLKDGVEPLVGGAIRGQADGEEYIVEPLSGSLYVFDAGSEEDGSAETPKVRKLPLSVEQLIELSPFTFPHSPSRIFTGSKHTSLISIDLRTGQQVDCFSSFASNRSAFDDCVCENEQLLDDMEGRARSNRDTLFVGRTDYRLTIHSPSGTSAAFAPSTTNAAAGMNGRARSGIQEITYSTYTPNTFDKPLAEYWAKAGINQQMWEEDGTAAKRMRVELGHDGVAVGVEEGGGVKWVKPLGSVGIAVYDILLPMSPLSARPILVPQPPPHLPSLFPTPAEPSPSHLDVLSKPPTTYIGTVPFPLALPAAPVDGSIVNESHRENREEVRGTPASRTEAPISKPLFYALSSTAYPLIHFAPPPRPGSLTNGSFLLSDDMPERDQLLPYLIDPPAEEKGLVPVSSDTAMIEHPRIHEREQPSQGWWWWFAGVLSALGVSAIALIELNRRATGNKQAVTPPIVSEKTPLLENATPLSVESARLVTFIEPVIDKMEVEGGSAIAADPEGTPKKKSTRRRVRGKGKKKKESSVSGGDGEGDAEEVEDDDSENALSSGSTPKKKSKAEKPLPDLPRVISSTDLKDEEDKERLAISDTIIGWGSHGTVVLKGTWGGRPVAVKRLLSDFTRLASHEVKLLQASDDHPNVIRYYCQEKRDNFLYIALDLCQASLADLIETPDRHIELASALDRKKALIQITSGVKHLHEMKIIHRDIKPQNVLVSRLKDGSLRMLVSDFGLARRLEHDQSSFAPTAANAAGSAGWRAPECIRGVVRLNEGFDRDPNATVCSSSSTSSTSSLIDAGNSSDDPAASRPSTKSGARLTKAVDLFALGCLYFWVLMSGEHPYGQTYDRESNIVKGEAVNMAMLDILGEEGWEAKELIGSMLSMSPQDRPGTQDCLGHPFFWTASKRLSFLCDASDRFEIMENDPPEATLVLLETGAVAVVGKDWFSRADKAFTSNLGKYRKYKGNSVKDLLRAMRNKKHHYQDLDPVAKRLFGSLPIGFLQYFTSRYPSLFMHVYRVIKESRLQKEPMFDQYFQDPSSA